MKTKIKNGNKISAAFRLSLACLTLTFIAQSETLSQETILPPRAGLLPVHKPDLEKLEAKVRQHLLSMENSLAAALKDSSTDDGRLSEAYGLMGQVYQAYALTSAAEECYLNAHRLAPKDFRWVYFLGNICQQSGRAEEAITYYRLARRLRPDYLPAPVNLGNLYLQQNQLEEARASFKEALAIDAKCAAAQYGLGQAALSTRNYAEAIRYLEQALAQVPDANRIHYALAMAYRGLGDIDKAQSHLQQQGSVGVRVPDPLVDEMKHLIQGERVHLIRGRLAFDARRFSEAMDEFRKAVAANPDSIPARVNLGSTLAQMGNHKEAMDQFREVIRIEPRNTTAHYNLGFLLASGNQHDEAISHLQTVLRLDAGDREARYLLAQELLRAGRAEESLAEFSRVVEADPSNEGALLEEVKLLSRYGKYREAIDRLDKGNALFPQKGRTAATFAYMLASCPDQDLRNGAKALELSLLVYKASGSASHGAIVAMALAETGRCSEAARWQRQMIEVAERERNSDLAMKLKADLPRYEKSPPCRP